MNPFLSKELAAEHIRDLRDAAGRANRGRADASSGEPESGTHITVRRFTARDIDGVQRLAALDEKPVPTGGVLVAAQAGELVAALPLDGGEALADPFKPTADAVALLHLRAKQLRAESNRPRIRWNRLHMPRGRLAA
ncbi:MAG TPA: hypothetical protein VF032_13150 [Thermoleophilaceae bacterium]